MVNNEYGLGRPKYSMSLAELNEKILAETASEDEKKEFDKRVEELKMKNKNHNCCMVLQRN